MLVVIEILNDDDSPVAPDDEAFEVEQLSWAEGDRAEGYVTLDTTNYAFPVRIVGIARQNNVAPPGDLPMVFIEPI